MEESGWAELKWVGSPVHQAANELKMNNVIIVMQADYVKRIFMAFDCYCYQSCITFSSLRLAYLFLLHITIAIKHCEI